VSGRNPADWAGGTIIPDLDRRSFLGGAAALSALAVLPQASFATELVIAPRPHLLADWSIDDMWGVYPRYADPIGYARRRDDAEVRLNPIDYQFG
jgi:TAT (twin-arginine translocation) pathway signal sequence